MKLYLISGVREYLMAMIYDEIIGHQSFEIQHRTEMMDGTDGLYIKVDKKSDGYFKTVCRAYNVTIRFTREEAA